MRPGWGCQMRWLTQAPFAGALSSLEGGHQLTNHLFQIAREDVGALGKLGGGPEIALQGVHGLLQQRGHATGGFSLFGGESPALQTCQNEDRAIDAEAIQMVKLGLLIRREQFTQSRRGLSLGLRSGFRLRLRNTGPFALYRDAARRAREFRRIAYRGQVLHGLAILS